MPLGASRSKQRLSPSEPSYPVSDIMLVGYTSGCGDDQNKINPDIMDMNEDWWETPDMTGVTQHKARGEFYSFLDEISTSIQARAGI